MRPLLSNKNYRVLYTVTAGALVLALAFLSWPSPLLGPGSVSGFDLVGLALLLVFQVVLVLSTGGAGLLNLDCAEIVSYALTPLREVPELCVSALHCVATSPSASAYRDAVVAQPRELRVIDSEVMHRLRLSDAKAERQHEKDTACRQLHGVPGPIVATTQTGLAAGQAH